MLASALGSGMAAVLISLNSQAENNRRLAEQQLTSDRKFCALVIAQDDAWSETTPTSVTGKRVAEAMRELRRQLDCPPN